MLKKEDKKIMLNLVRNTINFKLGLDIEKQEPPNSDLYKEYRGVFVTLKKDNKLRGCIGYPKPVKPLYEAITDMAESAAFHDPRFQPVEREEVEKIKIEISILSKLEIVNDISEIIIGRDGLIIQSGYYSGLLLPQVAIEHNWDVKEFLEQTCLKAGLYPNSYLDNSVDVYRFSAEIFSE